MHSCLLLGIQTGGNKQKEANVCETGLSTSFPAVFEFVLLNGNNPFLWQSEAENFHLCPAKVKGTLENTCRDFPGCTEAKNPPANAGDMGLSPGPGRFHMPRSNWAHAPPLLRPRATTTEARAPRAHAPQQEKPWQWEAHAPQRRVAPAHHN